MVFKSIQLNFEKDIFEKQKQIYDDEGNDVHRKEQNRQLQRLLSYHNKQLHLGSCHPLTGEL